MNGVRKTVSVGTFNDPSLTVEGALIDRAVRRRSRDLARDRERYADSLLRDKLPRRLHWLIDHPRLLKRVLRVVKRWKPSMTTVYFAKFDVIGGMGEEQARRERDAWVAEHLSGAHPGDGLIFAYTDQSGLPAEIYGVR